jgi:hypothetical protein
MFCNQVQCFTIFNKVMITQDRLDNYLTVGEAARFLGVSPATLRNRDKAGKLTPYRHPLNKYRLYLKTDLEKLLQDIKQNDYSNRI